MLRYTKAARVDKQRLERLCFWVTNLAYLLECGFLLVYEGELLLVVYPGSSLEAEAEECGGYMAH